MMPVDAERSTQADASDESGVRPPLLDDPAPLFRARTTMGERDVASYRGRWLVFFSHPADFTPVCTSEFIGFAQRFERFQAMGCDLLALSVDSLFSHLAWVRNLKERFGIEIPFPVVEDPSMAIARAYGMIRLGAASSATVRATFVIDPGGIVRAIIWYPMTTGRSVEEILRLLAALQMADASNVSTPEGWKPGELTIEPAPVTVEEAERQAAEDGSMDWYYRLNGR